MPAYQVHTEARGPHWIAWITHDGGGKPHQSVILIARTQEEAESPGPGMGRTRLKLGAGSGPGPSTTCAKSVSVCGAARRRRRDVPHLDAARDERIGDQLSVTPPPDRFRAHDHGRRIVATADELSEGLRERRRSPCSRRTRESLRPARPCCAESRPWLAPARRARGMAIGDPRFAKRRGQRLLRKVRMTPRLRNRADVAQLHDPVRLEQLDELARAAASNDRWCRNHESRARVEGRLALRCRTMRAAARCRPGRDVVGCLRKQRDQRSRQHLAQAAAARPADAVLRRSRTDTADRGRG